MVLNNTIKNSKQTSLTQVLLLFCQSSALGSYPGAFRISSTAYTPENIAVYIYYLW